MDKIIKQRVLMDIVFVLLNLFLVIFAFKTLGGVKETLAANFLVYFGIFITFVVLSIYISRFKIDIKYIFTIGILVSSCSFLIFILGTTPVFVYAFMFVWGLGQGFVWNGINTNELISVEDSFKTSYVTKIGFYRKIVSVVVPMLLTTLFAIFADLTYFIIFSLAAICLFVSAYFAYISFTYVPKKISLQNFKEFSKNAKVAPIKSFMFLDGMTGTVFFVVGPIAAFLVLKNEVNVGLYQTLASVFSLILLYIGTKKRGDSDNGKIFLISIFSFLPFILFFALSPNLFSFICLSVAQIICLPQMSISRHYIDLTIMKLGENNSKDSFYPNMIFRELYLFYGRTFAAILFFAILFYFEQNLLMLSAGYIFLAILYILKAGVGYRVISKIQA